MSAGVSAQMGWKPIPLALKVLSALMLLWAAGSAMNLPYLMENGLPVLGMIVSGASAFLVVLCLDFIGPAVFFYALWTRKSWGVKWAAFYIGLFALNGFVALLTVSNQLGVAPILVPTGVSLIFLAVILWKRSYFANQN